MTADGKGARSEITRGRLDDKLFRLRGYPAESPDGKLLAFNAGDWSNPWQLFVVSTVNSHSLVQPLLQSEFLGPSRFIYNPVQIDAAGNLCK